MSSNISHFETMIMCLISYKCIQVQKVDAVNPILKTNSTINIKKWVKIQFHHPILKRKPNDITN